MKFGIAALLLLCTAALPLQAEPLERSPRPKANPTLAKSEPLVASATADIIALIGPELPASTPITAPAARAVAAPPVNPRTGVITLSMSNRLPEAVIGPVPAPAARAETDLPFIAEMLPAAMPQPVLPAPATVPGAAPEAPVALAAAVITPPTAPAPAAAPGLRPKARPAAVEKAASLAAAKPAPADVPESAAPEAVPARATILLTSLRPKKKPANIVQLASAAAPVAVPAPEADSGKGKKKSKEPVSAKGSVCGVAAIKGEKIAPITSKVQGCGLSDGVRVTSVSGVRLSMAATIDCATAKALNTWVERVAQPAYGNKITELQIAGHYVCRPRNNKKGAKVSEHGRGKAVDISGFRLASGKVIRVLGGFDATMRKAHRGACGIFGTTLGPGSDGYHEDHLHFDTAAHRSGSYCR